MPTLTVVAGANGSGKSTLTKQLDRSILLIDPDAIAKELNPLDPVSVAIAAGRQALALAQQSLGVKLICLKRAIPKLLS
ncbi:hypothetical protein [Chamaesiphon sp.]|uniref:hypothetical protein n=1 Tax=Chamaesiphon sp. TaxID=2814140 RepID=UPI003593E6A9